MLHFRTYPEFESLSCFRDKPTFPFLSKILNLEQNSLSNLQKITKSKNYLMKLIFKILMSLFYLLNKKIKLIFMIQKMHKKYYLRNLQSSYWNYFKKLEILKVPDLVKFNSLCFINMIEGIFHLPLNTPFSRENRSKQYILNVPFNKKLHSFPS